MDRKPTIRVDFQNADAAGRVRLNTRTAQSDMAQLSVAVENGMALRLVDDDLEADGTAFYSDEEGIWTAVVDWAELGPPGRQPA